MIFEKWVCLINATIATVVVIYGLNDRNAVPWVITVEAFLAILGFAAVFK